jgi:hypothetical protein
LSAKRRIVVDTSVLRSAGGDAATFPTSKHCRDLLLAVLNICHKAVVGEALLTEWDKHQSRFARKWRLDMTKKKKIIRLHVPEQPGLRQQALAVHAISARDQDAILKDFHLAEAAIATDWIVVSLDTTVRDLLALACQEGDQLALILWVHPDDQDILEWLGSGAMPRPGKHLLDHKPSSGG